MTTAGVYRGLSELCISNVSFQAQGVKADFSLLDSSFWRFFPYLEFGGF